LEFLEDRLAPATHTWNGSASNLWSNGSNWTGGSPAGDPTAALVFPGGSVMNPANSNDITGLTVQSITFSGNGYSIGGTQGIALAGGITADAGVTMTDTMSLSINLTMAQTITVANSGAKLSLSGIVSGAAAAGLTKAGAGELALSAANTYAGGTILMAGTLTLANNGALGSGALTLDGGTLQASADTTITNSLIVGGNATIGGSSNLTLNGSVTLMTGNTLTVSNTATTTLAGVVSGAGQLTADAGTGNVVLSAVNTYTGRTTLNSGQLTVRTGSALGTGPLALNGGTLLANPLTPQSPDISLSNTFSVGGAAMIGGSANLILSGPGTLAGSNTLTVSNTASTTISGIVTGSGNLAVAAGTGNVFVSASNTYTGSTTLTSGTVTVSADNALGTGSLALNGGTLQASRAVTLANAFTVGGMATIGGPSFPTGALGGGNITFTQAGSLGVGNTLTVTNTGTTTFGGSLSGAGNLTVMIPTGPGTSTVILAAASTYTGTTTLSGGQLVVNTSTSLGAGALVLGTGKLSAGVNFISLSNPFTADAGATIAGNNSFALSGPGTLNSTLTISNTASTIGLLGILSGSGGIVRDNQPGSLVLGAANTYTGSTAVNGGFLQAASANALPAMSALTVATGATVLLNTFDQTIPSLAGAGTVNIGSATLTVGSSTSATFTGTLMGSGSLVKVGTGTLTLAGVASGFASITIDAGTLQLGAAFMSSSSAVTIASGATFDLNNFSATIGSLSGAGNVTLGSGAGATLTVGGNNSSTTFSGVISGNGAPGVPPTLVPVTGLNKTGTGTLTLTGANTYTGTTTISGGTLRLGVANALPTTSNVSLSGNGTLDLNNFNVTIGSLAGAGAVILGTGTLTLAFDSTPSSVPFSFAGVMSGTGGVTKTGSGVEIFDGNNTYTGPTTVMTGTLLVDGSQPSSNVTVAAGATFGGSGTVGTVTTSGAIIPEGLPLMTPGILHASSVTFNTGSSLTFILNTATVGSGYSQLNVTGSVTLSGSPALNLLVGFSQLNGLPAVGATFTIITAGSVTGSFGGQADGSSITINGNVFRVNYTSNSSTLTLTTLSSNNQRFVTQVYQDLLQRAVDSSGLAFWSGQLDHGTSRSQVVSGIESSLEYRTVLVRGFYQTYLHRPADPVGLSSFVAMLGAGSTDEQVQSLITGSQEYFQTRGGGTNDGFLSALYQDALNRMIDPGGHMTFLNALNNGAARSDVAATIFASTEYRNDLVQGYYMRFLHRAADAAGQAAWVNMLQAGARDEDVIAGIVGSAEYFGRV
jgi:autotransporter-associated beta strand protein